MSIVPLAAADLSALLEAFHAGDLEPGAVERYEETCAIVNGILGMKQHTGSMAWLWFALETLDWIGVRTDYDEYAQTMTAPWPHPFITQDILKSWAYMSIFFPQLEQCEPSTVFLKSEEGQKYQNSLLHNPHERSQTLPDVRTPTSFRYRPKAFWKDWEKMVAEAKEGRTYYADSFPMEWSIAIRPILAKCKDAFQLSASRRHLANCVPSSIPCRNHLSYNDAECSTDCARVCSCAH